MNLELEITRALSGFDVLQGRSNLEYAIERGLSRLRVPTVRPSTPGVKGRELTYGDVRDERIEVAAQHSLVRLSKKTPAERQAATEMWAAIKGGQLAAIYQENMT